MLQIVQNKKRTETKSENDNDDDYEEGKSEEAGIVYDTSERDGRYEPIWTDPENETLQLHNYGELPQSENSKINIRRSNRNVNKANGYGSVPYQRNFCMRLKHCCYRTNLSRTKGTPQPLSELVQKP